MRRRSTVWLAVLPALVAAVAVNGGPAAPAAAAPPAAAPGHVVVTAPRTNAEVNPLGIDDPAPRLSWALASSQRAVLQTGYRVLVATRPDRLREGRADVWDSGDRRSAEPAVQLSGRPLAPRTRYFWSVRVDTDTAGRSAFASPAWFETAYLDPGQWRGGWISGPPREAWPLTGPQGAWDDGCCLPGAAALAADVPAGSNSVQLAGTGAGSSPYAGFFPGGTITVGSGAAAQTATITAVGSTAAGTELRLAAPAGASNVKVTDVTGVAVGSPVTVGSGAAAQTVVVTAVGSAGGSSTLLHPAAAGSSDLYVPSVAPFNKNQPAIIGSGAGQEVRTVVATNSAAPAPTALAAPAAAGARTVYVDSIAGVIPAAPLVLGTGAGSVTAVPTAVGTAAAAPTALAAPAAAGDAAVQVGSGAGFGVGFPIQVDTGTAAELRTVTAVGAGTVSFTPALSTVHAAGLPVRSLGAGIRLRRPLPAALPAGTAVQGSGQGITVSPPLARPHPAGESLVGAGQGLGVTPALSTVHAAGTAVVAGTGVQFTPALAAGHAAGEPAASTPLDLCRPASNADNQSACREIRPAPMLRRSFPVAPVSAHGRVVSARVHASGLGYNDMSLNGAPTSDRVVDPAFTNYTQTVYYQTDDVTALIRQDRTAPAENVVAAELGSGQFDDDTDGGNWGWVTAPWRATPQLRADLWITYADGTEQLVASDRSWRVTLSGPTRYTGHYVGETYDARKAIPGWNQPGFDATSWPAARAATAPLGRLTAQRKPATRVVATWPAGTAASPAAGVLVYDIGQLRPGFGTVAVSGAPAGTPIQVLYSDKTNAAGAVSVAGCCIRDQIQTDLYVADGTGTAAAPELWTPRFSYKGTRYVQISGPRGAALPAGVTVELRSFTETRAELAQTGTFDSGSPLLNQIESATRNSVAANYVGGIITDTPQYEKNPWTGDESLSAPAASLQFDTEALYRARGADQATCQSALGELVQLCPNSGTYGYLYHTPNGGFKRSVVTGSTPIWDSAAFTVPWEAYRRYGDPAVLRTAYPVMRSYLDNWMPRFGQLDGDGLQYTVTSDLGDWSFPRGTEGAAAAGTDLAVPSVNGPSSTAYYAYLATIAGDTARALGDRAGAARYQRLHDRVAADYNQRWWDAAAGFYRENASQPFTQTMNLLPLAFDLVPTDRRAALAAALVGDIMVTRTGHEEVGIVGARWIGPVLSQAAADGVPGAAAAAYTIAQQTTYPSIGYWAALGWTGLGENWESTTRTRSHHMFGSIAQWFYEDLAGVQPTAPGYRTIAVSPTVAAGIDHATATYQSVRGPVSSSWRVTPTGLVLDVTIPANATATVSVPAAAGATVTETGSGRRVPADRAPGVRPLRRHGGYLDYAVGSGSYSFQVSTLS